jgi:hypothetical protein
LIVGNEYSLPQYGIRGQLIHIKPSLFVAKKIVTLRVTKITDDSINSVNEDECVSGFLGHNLTSINTKI